MANTIELEPTSDAPLDDVYCPWCGHAFAGYVDHCPDDGTRLLRGPRDPMLGTTIDARYRIRRRIGDGGMGIVYEAVQLSIDRAVAIKVIRESMHHDRAAAKRFLREAQLVTGINHPNVVHIFDYGETDGGAPYLVMELLVGRTLAEVLAAAGRLDVRRACEVGIQLCDALAAAHARGVIHRDLKPANVVLLDAPAVRDLVKVLDFGLAKSLSIDESSPATTLTQAGALLGTPLYMAPEAMGGVVDQRSDLYSLGCMLYELVAGTTPFSDTSINMVLARHLADAPPALPDDVPSAFVDVVTALLAKSPDQRPASAASVRGWLQAIHDAPPDLEVDDVPTLIHQPRLDQRRTVREIPPRPARRPSSVPRAVPFLLVSLSFLVFAAVIAVLILRIAQ